MRWELSCDALLFDCDGVLVDSTDSVARVWREWATRRGVDPDLSLRVAHGRRTVDTLRVVAPQLDPVAEADLLTQMEVDDAATVRCVPGARELLASLSPACWAVVTSGTGALATARMNAAGLPPAPLLISVDDVALGKPDPECYVAASKALRVAPDACVVIEDAPAGIDAARAAGMRVVAVLTTHDAQELITPWIARDLRAITFHADVDHRFVPGRGVITAS